MTAQKGEREEALKAARRIDVFDPTFPNYEEWDDALIGDARTVARALLSSSKAEQGMREALEEIANYPTNEPIPYRKAQNRARAALSPEETVDDVAVTPA
jgi:hypothetical protein